MMLAVSDGEQHTRLRRAVNAWFRPSVVQSLARSLGEMAGDLVRNGLRDTHLDVDDRISRPLTEYGLFQALNVPEADWSALSRLTDSITSVDARARSEAYRAVVVYCLEHKPRPAEEPPGAFRTPEERALNVANMILAGIDTSRMALTTALYLLASNPREWRALRTGAVPVATAVEESLRWASPAGQSLRTVVTETELAGQGLGVGDWLVLWWPSANRCGSQFESSAEFRLDRPKRSHLAFGAGPHYCVGAPLARLELTALVQALVQEVAAIELVDEPSWAESVHLNGVSRLRVRLS
jgi:cytochrome P450